MSGSATNADGTSTTSVDDRILNPWLDVVGQSQDVSKQLLDSKVPMQHVADQSQDTKRADSVLNAAVNNDAGFKQLADAQDLASQAGKYNPDMIDPMQLKSAQIGPVAQVNGRDVQYLTGDATTAGNFRQAAKVTAPDFTGAQKMTIDRGSVSNVDPHSVVSDLGKYQNPFQQDVIDASMNELEHQRQLQKNADKADFAASNAFGNSRRGVVEANTNADFLRDKGNLLASLNNQGFNTATGLRTQDVNNQYDAQKANQAADLNVFSQNAAQKQQTELFNATGQAARQDANAALKQQTQLFNAQNQGDRQEFNAGQKQAMDLANLQFGNAARAGTAANDQAARMYNADALNTAGLSQAQLAQQTGLANQATDLSAQGSNQQAGLAGASQDLAASQQLAALGAQKQNMGLTNVNALNQQGQINQGQAQSQLDAIFKNATAKYNQPIQALQVAESPFNVIPSMGSGGTSNTQSSGKGIGF